MRLSKILILLCSLLLVSCESEPPTIAFDEIDLSIADAGSGEKLFSQSNNGAPTCVSCHMVEDGEGGGIGPSLAGIGRIAGERVDGEDAVEYLYWSIVRPARYVVAGYSNVMYANYDEAYVAADIADLIAYMQTLE